MKAPAHACTGALFVGFNAICWPFRQTPKVALLRPDCCSTTATCQCKKGADRSRRLRAKRKARPAGRKVGLGYVPGRRCKAWGCRPYLQRNLIPLSSGPECSAF